MINTRDTKVWITYQVHVQRPSDRYPVRQSARTLPVYLHTDDVDQALKSGAAQLGAHLAGRRKGRRS